MWNHLRLCGRCELSGTKQSRILPIVTELGLAQAWTTPEPPVFEEQCVGAMPPKVGKKAVAKKKERMIEDKVSVCVNCAAQHHPFEPISCPVDGHAMYAVVVE
jgi:hypothetical protein